MNPIRLLALLLACVSLACTTGSDPGDKLTPEERREKLLAGAASLDAGRDAWLDRRLRKFTTLSVAEEHMPQVLRDMGYTDASVDEDFVILLRGKDLVDGTLVFTGPPGRVPLLEKTPGVRMQDTIYPEIKELFFDRSVIEKNAVQPAR
jgi:hypothetical protein